MMMKEIYSLMIGDSIGAFDGSKQTHLGIVVEVDTSRYSPEEKIITVRWSHIDNIGKSFCDITYGDSIHALESLVQYKLLSRAYSVVGLEEII